MDKKERITMVLRLYDEYTNQAKEKNAETFFYGLKAVDKDYSFETYAKLIAEARDITESFVIPIMKLVRKEGIISAMPEGNETKVILEDGTEFVIDERIENIFTIPDEIIL